MDHCPQQRHWISENRLEWAFLGLLLLLSATRGYWTPDEPDFAQCIKEMRLRDTWMFPWLNGVIYTEKPILFYWLMKGFNLLGDKLSGGFGFSHGIAPWALRLPSVFAAAGFLFAFRAWLKRFFDAQAAGNVSLVLTTSPLWLWQAQFIQIDMLFSALVAWSWLCWFSGYALLRNLAESRQQQEPGCPETHARRSQRDTRGFLDCLEEHTRWFLMGYATLGLAVLAKGPLALVLSGGVIVGFLFWQRDWRALGQMKLSAGLAIFLAIVLPWYIAAAIQGGPQYAYAMIIHQNFERALKAWDHIQPWWRYVEYLAADFFPWSLALPIAIWHCWKHSQRLTPLQRFAVTAWAVPFVLLSCSKSKQGKYLLMSYPFLAMTVVTSLQALTEKSLQRFQRLLGSIFTFSGLLLLLIGFAKAGGKKLQIQIEPVQGPLCLIALLLTLGGLWMIWQRRHPDSPPALIPRTALVLGTLFTLALPWAFSRLDPGKDFKLWAKQSEPMLQGHRLFFWGEIRSGAMIYSDHLLLVIPEATQLSQLKPGDRLIATKRQWRPGTYGLTQATQDNFQLIFEKAQGGDGLLILTPKISGN